MTTIVVAGAAAALAAVLAVGEAPDRLLRRRLPPPSAAQAHRWGRARGPAVVAAAAVLLELLADRPHLVLVAVVVVAVAAAAVRLSGRGQQRRERAACRARVIEFCDALVAELRAGQPPPRAITLAAENWSAVEPVAATALLGGDVAGTLRAQASRPGAEPFAAIAAGWEVAHSSGAGLADVLDRLSGALRDDEDIRLDMEGALGPPRATARLLAVLPLLGAALGTGLGGDPVGLLLGSMFGAVCLAAGAALAVSGLFWVEHIARQAEL